jgi:hypothetical protein
MPMVAMFIVFEFVVHNPLHAETKKNLSYLDIVAAHYARLDLLAQGTVHDAKVAEFTSIARLYVESLTGDQGNAPRDNTALASSISGFRPVDSSIINEQRPNVVNQYEVEQLSTTEPEDAVCHLLDYYSFHNINHIFPGLPNHLSHDNRRLEYD